MGFIVLLKFSLWCIDFLAWPVIALGYPVFASIRAIETGSVYHLRKLVIYWTLFSLISLFDYAFVKIIEWIPFWSSIKLVVICWLVLPRFQGAYYSYQRFIRPCLVVNLQEAIGSLGKPKEEQEQPRAKEMILDVVEKYLKENGSEALEMIIARKVSYKVDRKEPFNSQKDDVMEPDVKTVVVASKQLKEPVDDDDHDHKGKEMLKSPKKIAATEATKQCQHARPVTSFWVPKETTYVAPKPKDSITPTETSAENRKPTSTHHPPLKALKESSVEQEWTCPLCEVVITCEKDLEVHLSGKKHKSMCESLKSSKLAAKPKDTITPPTETSAENKRPTLTHYPPLKESSVKQEWTCPPCQVVTTSENDLKIHLRGKKHKSMWETLKSSRLSALDTGASSTHHPPLNKSSVEQEWTCPLCQVVTTCENNLKMHLSGKKHKSMCDSLNSSKLSALDIGPSSSSPCPSFIPKIGKNQVRRRNRRKSLKKVSPEKKKEMNLYQVS